MSDIYETVLDALETLTLPVLANADRSADATPLPDVYLVFFVVTDMPAQHADDEDWLRFTRVSVNYFSRSGLSGMPDIDSAMKTAGFAVSDKAELPYSLETGHFGRNCSYTKVEVNETCL